MNPIKKILVIENNTQRGLISLSRFRSDFCFSTLHDFYDGANQKIKFCCAMCLGHLLGIKHRLSLILRKRRDGATRRSGLAQKRRGLTIAQRNNGETGSVLSCRIQGAGHFNNVKVCHLYISPGHNFFGHHNQPPGEFPVHEVLEVDCVAGRGIQGDRFFDFKENYKGQITFFEQEVFDALCAELNLPGKSPGLTRRNVIVAGVELNSLIGTEFEIQGVRFRGMTECAPCYWMDQALAPGAEKFLQNRGGLRAQILTSGKLRTTS